MGLADGLTIARLAAAAALPSALVHGAGRPGGSHVPLLLCCFAAATDFADGRVARRRGPTPYGALLDGVADVAFVLAATATGVAIGLLPVVVPITIAVAFGAYALPAFSPSRGPLPRTPIGHAAGVCNYVLAGLLGAAVAWPAHFWGSVLEGASATVTALNGAAVVLRVVGRARRRATSAHAWRGAGRRGQWPRSSA